MLFFLLIVITMFVVLISSAIRKIPVQFAKRVVGRKVYGGQASHIPLKILTAGVMPIIFASALIFLPITIANFTKNPVLIRAASSLNPGAANPWPYAITFFALILGFAYFYASLTINPIDISTNLKRGGVAIPGVRPGKSTSDYIDNILTKVTLPASIFLALIAIFPTFLTGFFKVDFHVISFVS